MRSCSGPRTRRRPEHERCRSRHACANSSTHEGGDRTANFGPGHHVFGNEVGERIGPVRHAWDNTCRRAGTDDLNIRDLRREFGSRLLKSGAAGIHDVSYWLGHTSVATTSQCLWTTVDPVGVEGVGSGPPDCQPIANFAVTVTVACETVRFFVGILWYPFDRGFQTPTRLELHPSVT